MYWLVQDWDGANDDWEATGDEKYRREWLRLTDAIAKKSKEMQELKKVLKSIKKESFFKKLIKSIRSKI
jgi:hypothetical protein